jgi:nucleotide-binding universal stress UspA family protein
MIHTIVVPLDGSNFGEHAIPFALSVARQTDANLRLVHVHAYPQPLYTSDGVAIFDAATDEHNRVMQLAYLDDLSTRVAAQTTAPLQTALVEGPVAEAIETYVETVSADLIVMTTHGRGPLSRFWLGSVADALVRRSTVPMLLVRPDDSMPAPLSLGSTRTFARILLPLDGSQLSEQMIGAAADFAALSGAELTLLMALDPTGMSYAPILYTAGLEGEVLDQMKNEAHAYLEEAAAPLRDRGLRVKTQVVYAQPAVAILNYAFDHGSDLIAMATHGRSGLSRALLGSVADKILRGAHIPLLVQRPTAEATAEHAHAGVEAAAR